MARGTQFLSATLTILLFLIAPPYLHAGCEPMVRAEDNGLVGIHGKPQGPAVILSTPVQVPELKFRFVDEKNQPVQSKVIQVTYSWKWLEYPYPEHEWGAWLLGYDFVKCTAEPGETVVVPEYVVAARGWYKGKYTSFPWARKPQYDGVGVYVGFRTCDSSFGIKRSEYEHYLGKVAVVQLMCSHRPKISFTDR
jgi:hypothetical protein